MPDQVIDPYRAYNFKLTFQPNITDIACQKPE